VFIKHRAGAQHRVTKPRAGCYENFADQDAEGIVGGCDEPEVTTNSSGRLVLRLNTGLTQHA
jgi:hypothetical protein